ncbi:MAG: Asp-tRNA(Asn)/Glu-tRNA(Gln) amidotransferase subunit GatC [Planctomycetes bacterium]|nr:Asp-tRNA(Asn)/Glu-tRNA(Gln) amidotransferase subunit GatC [Planctomycetota bacterium]
MSFKVAYACSPPTMDVPGGWVILSVVDTVIRRETVESVAKLSRLGSEKEDLESLSTKLSAILDAFRVIQSVSTGGLQDAEHHSLYRRANLREDSALASTSSQTRALRTAPESYNGHFRVPPVLS